MKETNGNSKQTFLTIFFVLVLFLSVMPFVSTFNDVLTRIVMSVDGYKFIQEKIVPWEVRMVGVILYPFGFHPSVAGEYLAIGEGKPFLIEIAWNCIGWQSLIFFIMTGWVGLQGDKYTMISKIKAWMLGLLGTFLVNLLRIALVVMVAYYFGQNVGSFFHDYGSLVVIVCWLFFFWWFVYGFVLEERIDIQ